MKFDDPWIDGYIKKLEKENESMKGELWETKLEFAYLYHDFKKLEQEIELLKCENESLGHWNKKLRGEAK